ncbi:hypothetical protein BST97_03300 [Nonlabens spongiae]|uniref:DUF2071 domain-containing protein n=1 Tax=Nonlabens spongiae TaxID=331648 RepID=A0A1W6MHQ3_9FLAO|nr:DUF2071 domain-containing protein [Nonlabens spongiae]ARN77100.1 hypothetical protein BST97_03300 [Nonlabens spongiae]
MNFLKNHPFTVQAHFKSSIVFTYAIKKEELKHLIPQPLTLDTFNDKWGFIAVAMVQTKQLRPKGFPKFMGNDFFLIGYRIFVRYRNQSGKNLRGLYILKSETDKLKMQVMGNLFTHYNYTTTDITIKEDEDSKSIFSKKSNFKVRLRSGGLETELPEYSPFSDWKEARKFAGPLPHTFTIDSRANTILTILGRRKNWKPQPVQVLDSQFMFIEDLKLQSAVLANAFEIKNVDYHWDKGKIERWK